MTTEQKIAAATARIKELETLIKLWKTQSTSNLKSEQKTILI
jgi:hypothetical protein